MTLSLWFMLTPDNASPREALSKNTHKYGLMFIQTTLFVKPSIRMKDENRQNVSLKLACTVCEADNNNTLCCLFEPVFQGALVT